MSKNTYAAAKAAASATLYLYSFKHMVSNLLYSPLVAISANRHQHAEENSSFLAGREGDDPIAMQHDRAGLRDEPLKVAGVLDELGENGLD